tara:strand:- start:3129 stop:4478 length:1350 start_codon:yes stop_codon:yes gene_type:complete
MNDHLYNEVHRPQFHFTAKENWLNDPNGLVWVEGKWHLFFQHNPEATVWGNMTWGHAISDDLVHWRQVEHALYPDALGTMYSGSAVVDHEGTAGFGEGAVLAFYTAAGEHAKPRQTYTQCLAVSQDDGVTWEKYANNPVVNHIECANRDPKVIWHKPSQRWVMALYLAEDRFCLMRSTDAKSWERFQDVTLPGVSECPDFFPLKDDAGDEQWVFWGAKGGYQLGQFDGDQFVPHTELLTAEYGRNGYAAQTYSNAPDGRIIQVSWMSGGQYPEMPFNQQMSVPMELTLAGTGADARLSRVPVSELESLRARSSTIDDVKINEGTPFIADTDARLIDVSLTLTPCDSGQLVVSVRGQPLVVDWGSKELRFQNGAVDLGRLRDQRADAELKIQLLVDLTSVEVFLNEGEISGCFCFLPGAYIHPLVLMARGVTQEVLRVTLFELRSSWNRS